MNHSQPQTFTRNLAIMASAGTGKTYQLAMRYILLILRGALPEDIVAVTFTKKAAGEIFEKIMTLLLELIFSEERLCEAIRNGFLPEGTDAAHLTSVLQKILTCRKHLHIETNDSFLRQTVQSAPARFGIMGKITLLPEEDDRPRQRALLQALHAPEFASSSEASYRKRQDIYMILRDSSMGVENSNFCGGITILLKNFYPFYLEHPCREKWSLPIPDERKNDLLSERELNELAGKIKELLSDPFYDILREKKLESKFTGVLECAVLTSKEYPRSVDCPNLNFFLGENSKLPVLHEITEDTADFTFRNKKYFVKSDLFLLMRKLIRHMAASEFLLINRKTLAVYDLMAYFDKSYAMETRRRGLLTFQDILYLINNMERNDYGVLQILREKLALNIDHYLLDEFQDTSDSQWGAFRDLISDVIQWNEESRFTSFFMVADVKQSLYQWRKGNPEIFRRICCDYAILPEEKVQTALERSEPCGGVLKGLNRSFRSTEKVLQMVNDIFDPSRELVLPERLSLHTEILNAQRREMAFVPHVSGLKKERSSGCSMFLEVGDGTGDPNTECIRVICDMIRAMKLFSPERAKPLSVAVLARKNDLLQEFYETAAEYAPELEVSMEGKLYMKDSMCYALFRQTVIYAMHPGDQSSCGYFSTLRFPGGGCCSEKEIRTRLYPQNSEKSSLRTLIRSELEEEGICGYFRHFCEAFPESANEQEYREALEAALRNMEEESCFSADEMFRRLDLCSGTLRSRNHTVQLMTVHKSKGLGFDVVFYLGVTGGQPGKKSFSGESPDGSLYFLPRKIFEECSGVLQTHLQTQEKKDMYDFCCNLYVALTRAKYAQYFVAPSEKEESSAHSLHYADVLRSALAGKDHCVSDAHTEKFLSALRKSASPESESAKEEAGNKILSVNSFYCAGDPLWYEAGLKKEVSSSPSSPSSPSSAPAVSPQKEKELYSCVKHAVEEEKTYLRDLCSSVALCSRVLPGEVLRSSAPSVHKQPSSMRFSSMQGAELGSRLHEIFSRISYFSTPEELRQFLETYRQDEVVYEILKQAFSRKEVLDLFRLNGQEKNQVRLLVEQPFLMRGEDSSMINGVMDRAVIYFDENGHAVSGEVLDFKTDLLESSGEFRERYSAQLEIYRKALSLISSLPLEKISCIILAVRKGMVIRF